MGTQYTLKFYANTDVDVPQLKSLVTAYLLSVETEMSTYKMDSELSLLNAAEPNQAYKVSDDLFFVLDAAQKISLKSGGAFDITVGPLVNLWGFGPDELLTQQPLESEIKELLIKRTGFKSLRLYAETKTVVKEKELYLDLSAIAKGYAVDGLAALLEEKGIVNYLIEVGGELKSKGRKIGDGNAAWRIAIESPVDLDRSIQKIVELGDVSVATSGDYRNFFKIGERRFSHTIDPSTGFPVEHGLASVTVFHDSAMEADALATMLLVLGPSKAIAYANSHELPVFLIRRVLSKDSEVSFQELYSESFTPYLTQMSGK